MWKETVVQQAEWPPAFTLPVADDKRSLIPRSLAEPALAASQRAVIQRSAQPALPARLQAQAAQLVRRGYDPHDIRQVAYRAQQQWETWRKRLAPQDVPKSVGLGVYPDLPRAYQGPTSDIVLYEAARHPLVHQGTFYMPRPERERLLRLVDAGVDLPILVLDELPAGSVRRYGLDAITRHTQFFLPPPAHSTLDLNERLGRRAAFLNRAFGLAADGLAVAAAVALAPFMLLGLDPAVLGVISPRPDPRPGDPVFVFLLSAWRW